MIRNLFRRDKGLSCAHVMEVLQSYLDGEIDADTARKVAAHLDDCADCDLESRVYERIKASLREQPDHVEPDILANLRTFAERVGRGEVDHQ